MDLRDFWVIAVVSNPVRYQSRYRLYREFEARMLAAGINLLTVEMAYAHRPFEVTDPGNARHVQVRGHDEIWHKENLINLGAMALPETWKYAAWIDADVEFMRSDWAYETVQQLQHHPVVQLWTDAVDLGPRGEVVQIHKSWAACALGGVPDRKGYSAWHPGFAWAMRRDTWSRVGGLIEGAVLGAADHHMAWATKGRVVEKTPKEVTVGYKRMLETWQRRAHHAIRGDVGVVGGLIHHHWHGKKRDRRYVERWQILHKHNYDPDHDVVRDWRGVLHLTHEGHRLRHDIREYFRARDEDSVDLE